MKRGASAEQLATLERFRDSPLFNPAEKAALEYAERLLGMMSAALRAADDHHLVEPAHLEKLDPEPREIDVVALDGMAFGQLVH